MYVDSSYKENKKINQSKQPNNRNHPGDALVSEPYRSLHGCLSIKENF